MNIKYKTTKDFTNVELEDLFLSVQWSSGKYPDKLVVAMKNSDSVISAWDGNNLIGLINALSDGIMTAYFHYLLVKPDYQSKGVGKTLVQRMLENYKSYARKIVIAYDKEISFYQKCGFSVSENTSSMFITYLTT